MKKIAVKSPSVPALIIVAVIAIGIYITAGPRFDTSDTIPLSIQDNAIIQFAPKAPSAAEILPAAAGRPASAQNPAQNPALATIFNMESRLEPVPDAAGASTKDVLTVTALGVGIVVHPSGLILTTREVVDASANLYVKTASVLSPAKAAVINCDTRSDLCLIKISVTTPLPIMQIHEGDHLRPGEMVTALGIDPDMSQFSRPVMVSAVGERVSLHRDAHTGMIRLDSAFGGSSSGMPLVEQTGDVAGIFTHSPSRADVGRMGGFAVSAATIRNFLAKSVDRLDTAVPVIQAGNSFAAPQNVNFIARDTATDIPYSGGMALVQMDRDLAARINAPFPGGVMVNSVTPGGAADQAGIKPGDMLIKADGKFIRGPDDMREVLNRSRGAKVAIQLYRGSERLGLDLLPSAGIPQDTRMMAETRPNTPLPAEIPAMPQLAPPGNRDVDTVISMRRKQLIMDKAGLDPRIVPQNTDIDALTRIAADTLVARRLGLSPAIAAQGGTVFERGVTKIIWTDIARKLGLDPSFATMPGIEPDQLYRMAQQRVLADTLGLPPEYASMPGTDDKKLVNSAVEQYLSATLGRPAASILSNPANAAETEVRPVPRGQNPNARPGIGTQPDRDTVNARRTAEEIVARFGLDTRYLSMPDMTPAKLLQIAGDNFLISKFGLDPALISLPGMDRDRIVTAGMSKALIVKLGLTEVFPQNSPELPGTARIFRAAENLACAEKIGIPPDQALAFGDARGTMLRSAGRALLASEMGPGWNFQNRQ